MGSQAQERARSSYFTRFKEVLSDLEDYDSHPHRVPAITRTNSSKSLANPIDALPELSQSPTTVPLQENQAISSHRTPPTGPRSTYARIVKDGDGKGSRTAIADLPHRITGPAPPPLRGFPNFAQSNPPNRNLQLGSGRLQNTNKLGSS